MTKLENNIKNLCVENMGIYGCKHAVKEHVWTGKAHMIAKLKKNVKSMREEPFAYACMFFSVDTLVSCIKEILWEDREDVEKYIQNKRIAQELEWITLFQLLLPKESQWERIGTKCIQLPL